MQTLEGLSQGLLESAPDAIVCADRDGRIVLANSQAEALFGYDRRELIGQQVEILLPAGLRDLHRTHRSGYYADPHTRPMGIGLQLRARHKDGGEIPVEISLSPLHTAGEMLVTAVIRDVTERTRGEERLRFLSESSKLLASSLDHETTLQIVARLAVPSLADWCVVDLLEGDGGTRPVAAAHADPAQEEALRAGLRHPVERRVAATVLATGEAVLQVDLPEPATPALGDGATPREVAAAQWSPRAIMCAPLNARGRTFGVLSFATTRARGYDRADLTLAEELSRRAAVAVDNARLYGEADEALRLRNDVLAAVTHDLKNPLGAIRVHAEVVRLLLEQGGPTPDRVWEGLDRIDATAAQMTAELEELLDVARLEAGQGLVLNVRPTDLVALARKVVDIYRKTTEVHELRLHAETPSLVGEWDASRVERVLANLLSNAIRYSPDGGQIRVEITQEGDGDKRRAVLQVSDCGLGIPPADVPRVFDRFHRASNIAGRIRGTGLGLSITRQVVERHGGTIGVESCEGEGSTFTVRLPLKAGT
jgi:PAS domain S-box-containing protein